MEDAIKSIKAYLYDRDSSPLTGAYFIAWCVWNFKFILIILSSDPIRVKFINIESYLFEPSYFFDYSQWLGPMWIYGAPLILALLYLLALPKFSIKIYEQSLKNKKILNEKRQEIENQELLSKEESIRIRREIRKISEQYEDEIKQKDDLISDLKRQIEEYRKSTDEKRIKHIEITKNQKIANNLSKEALEILTIASSDGSGEIVCSDTFDGFSISTGGKELNPQNSRESAKLKNALIELETAKLIASKGNKRVIFEVTSLGYEIADLILVQQANI